MQTATKIALLVIVLTSAATNAYHNSAKLRRDGVLNLYPFPRVGRASKLSWELPVKDLYIEQEREPTKKQLYAFPRVGRSGYSREEILHKPLTLEEFLLSRNHDNVKRESENENESGMWFGPRLGRSFQAEEEDISQKENEVNVPEQSEFERKKRQTKH